MFETLDKILDESGIETPGAEGARIAWLIFTAVNTVTVIAFGVSFVMLAYAFIQFITSTGDPKRLAVPKSAITWSVLGLLLATALQVIKKVILDILGYDAALFF